MSLKINNCLNVSLQNLNQSSTFNNASREDASKNLALAQRLTTDKNPNIQDVSQIVMDIAKLIDSVSPFIKKTSNITSGNNISNSLNSAKKVTKIFDCPMSLRPTMIPTARATNRATSNPTSNATQTPILISDRKLSPELKVQIEGNLNTYIERNVDKILLDKLKPQPSYSKQFTHNGEANKTFGKCC